MDHLQVNQSKLEDKVSPNLENFPEDVAMAIAKHVRDWADLSESVGEREERRR